PKPGPPDVSTSTTRETPSASGLAQAGFCDATGGVGSAASLEDSEAVVSTSSLAGSFWAAAGDGGLAAIVLGGAASARRAEVQKQPREITTAATILARIRPNGLRIATLSKHATEFVGGATFAPGHSCKESLNGLPTRLRLVRRSRWIRAPRDQCHTEL